MDLFIYTHFEQRNIFLTQTSANTFKYKVSLITKWTFTMQTENNDRALDISNTRISIVTQNMNWKLIK